MEQHNDSVAAPAPPATGDVRVDEALAGLSDIDGLHVDAHPALFEQVHRSLTAALGALDSGVPGAAAPSGAHGASARSSTPGS
jgi:hypothetical protein